MFPLEWRDGLEISYQRGILRSLFLSVISSCLLKSTPVDNIDP